MENLIFSLNATVPIFFTMILGFVFRKVGLMDEEFTNKANKFVLQAALPALLFSDLSQANFRDVWNGTFVAYCALTTMICIVISILISCLWNLFRGLTGAALQSLVLHLSRIYMEHQAWRH